ncbi:kynurenine aminotransferase isoform X2 [Adelges cooleyi]|uniref:kynurenine aminotransferase isoform X2 n=1 Tax=Adelges cooleyi TaxID=133065 RepID=UPI00217F5B1F|nr:kynurenine aminotransferase isoform X2 [Adelges cooleyi]
MLVVKCLVILRNYNYLLCAELPNCVEIRFVFCKKIQPQNYKFLVSFFTKQISTTMSFDQKQLDKFKLPDRYKSGEYNVWIEFIGLAMEHKPVNLGQGFPDYNPPSRFSQYLSEVAKEGGLFNQYTRGFGHVRLVNALSKLYSKLIGRTINPLTEIMVTVGAYEALFCAIQGHIQPGDEAIIIEPFFDCYEPMVCSVGGVPRFISLKNTNSNASVSRASDWKLDPIELESLFNSKTKFIIINTPHNPLGKVFDLEELTMIANLCKKHNVLCISDEVYEWLVYEPTKHIRIASLPGMWERTITIGSAGKTFSMTGWKLGWAYGPDYLMKNLQVVHQIAIYTCPTTVQEAVAKGFEYEINILGTPDSYFQGISKELRPKLDFTASVLAKNGFKPIVPDGGYFMIADWTNFEKKVDLSTETDNYKDFKFVKWLVKNFKLQGIPFSVFFSEKNKEAASKYMRFCFFKKDETLQQFEEIATNFSKHIAEKSPTNKL